MSDHLAEQVERLAHHAFQGEVWDKAVAYCSRLAPRHSPAAPEALIIPELALVGLQHLPEITDARAGH